MDLASWLEATRPQVQLELFDVHTLGFNNNLLTVRVMNDAEDYRSITEFFLKRDQLSFEFPSNIDQKNSNVSFKIEPGVYFSPGTVNPCNEIQILDTPWFAPTEPDRGMHPTYTGRQTPDGAFVYAPYVPINMTYDVDVMRPFNVEVQPARPVENIHFTTAVDATNNVRRILDEWGEAVNNHIENDVPDDF